MHDPGHCTAMQKLVLALAQELEQNFEQAPRATEVESAFQLITGLSKAELAWLLIFYCRALFYSMKYSFGQFRTSVMPVSPPVSLFAEGRGRDGGDSGSRGKCLSTQPSTAKAWVLYQHCFSHKSKKPQCQVGCYKECLLQPDHVHVLTTYDQESWSVAWRYKIEHWTGRRKHLCISQNNFFERMPVFNCKAHLAK